VVYRWALGEVWARPQLSRRDRSVVVIAILTSLGSPTTLAMHIRGGLDHGLGRVEIEEIITHLGLYAGLPRAIEAMTVARDVFDEVS
jgi:alkylhydroperoxidase/carboxymuconolactone decarboxylase family protein YurZ